MRSKRNASFLLGLDSEVSVQEAAEIVSRVYQDYTKGKIGTPKVRGPIEIPGDSLDEIGSDDIRLCYIERLDQRPELSVVLDGGYLTSDYFDIHQEKFLSPNSYFDDFHKFLARQMS
jgi:hypothetical protein